MSSQEAKKVKRICRKSDEKGVGAKVNNDSVGADGRAMGLLFPPVELHLHPRC